MNKPPIFKKTEFAFNLWENINFLSNVLINIAEVKYLELDFSP